jgi:vitamin B12 transporter
MKTKVKGIALFFLMPLAVWGQAKADIQIKEITIKADKIQDASLGQKTVLYDSLTLQQYKTGSIADLLTGENAVNIKSYGSGLASISMRGTSASQTGIIWNGFNIQSPLNGAVDLSMVPIMGNDHIAIRIGGESALSGSGAMGGGIFITNRMPTDTGFHGNFMVGIGSFGQYRSSLGLAYRKNKLFISLNGNYQEANNNFEFRNVAGIGLPLQIQQNAAYQKSNIASHFTYTFSLQSALTANIWYSNADRFRTPTMTQSNNHQRQKDWALRTAVEYKYIQENNSLKLRAGYFDEFLLYYSDYIDSSRNEAKTYTFEVDDKITLNKNSELLLGVHYTHNTGITPNFAFNYGRDRVALYGGYNLHFASRQKLNFSLRQEMTDGQLIPLTASLGYELRCGSESAVGGWIKPITFRVKIAKLYNLPALNDLYWRQGGNKDLLPESGWTQEIGFDWKKQIAQTEFTTSLTVYNMNIQNWIQWAPIESSQFTAHNFKSVWSRGIEVDMQARRQFKNGAIKASLHYRFTPSTNIGLLGNIQDAVGKQLVYTPLHTLGFGLNAQYKNGSLSFKQSLIDKRFSSTDNDPNEILAAHTIGQINISYRLHHLVIGFDINNLWNADYQVIQYYAEPRRVWLLKVEWRF